MYDMELPPVIRVTSQQAEEHAAEIAEMVAAHPGTEVIVSEDTACPHCTALGITVGEDGVIRDSDGRPAAGGVHSTMDLTAAQVAALTGQPVPGQGTRRAQRTARRKAQRKARRNNR
jgi:hypothetical protein